MSEARENLGCAGRDPAPGQGAASGTSGKSSADSFGIRIVYSPVAPQPSTLPNSTPQQLKGGDIKVS